MRVGRRQMKRKRETKKADCSSFSNRIQNSVLDVPHNAQVLLILSTGDYEFGEIKNQQQGCCKVFILVINLKY